MNNFRAMQFPVLDGKLSMYKPMDMAQEIPIKQITVTEDEVRYAPNNIMKAVHNYYKENGTEPMYVLLNTQAYAAYKAYVMQAFDYRPDPEHGLDKFDKYFILCDPSQHEEALALGRPEREFGTKGPARFNPHLQPLLEARKEIMKLKEQLDEATREAIYASDAHGEAISDLEKANRKLDHLHTRVATLKRSLIPLYVLVGACVAVTIVAIFS